MPHSPRRFSKSDLNTSDSETYSPAVKKRESTTTITKKPLVLGTKRKSSIEYAKKQKMAKKEADTTTTDDNDDTEESDHKHDVKRKAPIKRPVGRPKKQVGKKEVKREPTDESETETDSEPDLEEELKKAISKKFTSYKDEKKSSNSDTSLTRAKTSKQITITKNQVVTSKTPAKTNSIDRTFKHQVITNVKNPNAFANNTRKSIDAIKIYYPNVEKKGVTNNIRNSIGNNSVKNNTPNSSVKNNLLNKSSSNINSSNKSSTNKIIAHVKPDSPQVASPKAKSEFDKLVDELFENETKLEKSKPETMIINNEPTDVYTLSIDDTLDDDEDLDDLAGLCEEVYEDEAVETPTVTTSQANRANFTNMGSAKVINVNSATQMLTAGKNMNGLPTHVVSSSNQIGSSKNQSFNQTSNSVNRTPNAKHVNSMNKTSSANQSLNTSSMRTSLNNSSIARTPTISRTPASNNARPVNKPAPTSSRATITPITRHEPVDYKEKYNKLHTSYEILSKKIAQYMEKTRAEKEQLKMQLKVEKAKLRKAQDDIETLKRKFSLLMKGRGLVKKAKT